MSAVHQLAAFHTHIPTLPWPRATTTLPTTLSRRIWVVHTTALKEAFRKATGGKQKFDKTATNPTGLAKTTALLSLIVANPRQPQFSTAYNLTLQQRCIPEKLPIARPLIANPLCVCVCACRAPQIDPTRCFLLSTQEASRSKSQQPPSPATGIAAIPVAQRNRSFLVLSQIQDPAPPPQSSPAQPLHRLSPRPRLRLHARDLHPAQKVQFGDGDRRASSSIMGGGGGGEATGARNGRGSSASSDAALHVIVLVSKKSFYTILSETFFFFCRCASELHRSSLPFPSPFPAPVSPSRPTSTAFAVDPSPM